MMFEDAQGAPTVTDMATALNLTPQCLCEAYTPLTTVGEIVRWLDDLPWNAPAYEISAALTQALVVTASFPEEVKK